MNKQIYFVSLGCAKNLTDTESMVALLQGAGHVLCHKIEEADYIIINTCAFIQAAKEEAVEEILLAAEQKKENPDVKIIVAGCLAQRYGEELVEALAEVDGFVGTGQYMQILNVMKQIEAGSPTCLTEGINAPIASHQRTILTKKPVAYLKISEGCSRNCTYCIIPQLRGDYRSRTLEDIVAEAKTLAKEGYRELVLVAQDVTLYGIDLYQEKALAKLLHALNEIDELLWIRLMYAYPEGIDDEIIDSIKTLDKVQKYIDMPLQHVNDKILKEMGRHTTKQQIEQLYTKLRDTVQGITLRTTFIVGFPGETEEEYREIVNFIEEYPFDKVGVFQYSREEGTPAAQMPHQVSAATKQRRQEMLMEKQQSISLESNRAFIGKKLQVLVVEKLEENIYLARSYRDAPDVDGGVMVISDEKLLLGQYYNCLITEADTYDLIGEVCKEDEHSQ
mgnify:CR=1 FL=1